MVGTGTQRVSAVFDSHAQAEQAVTALRQMGVTDTQLSVVAQHGGAAGGAGAQGGGQDDGDSTGERTGKGLLAGAGVGALFGLAALAIPGVGPFITAGWLAEALGVTAGAAAAGAIVGGTSGAITGALIKGGYSEHEANFYGSAVERGGVLVAVNTDGAAASVSQVQSVLSQYGGRVAGAAA